MTPNIERLEDCYEANVGRRWINPTSWNTCLIGGYCQRHGSGLFKRIMHDRWQDCFLIIGSHFGITTREAEHLFGLWPFPHLRPHKALLDRLRKFIDAHAPKVGELDFKDVGAGVGQRVKDSSLQGVTL